ncbi:hypothetical protein PRIPAC_76525 [Pristionchus pacificus]|uniref:G protein-coupled receptor n=1 Tax=Pristionchus pacificus TaxID=54126 RepID=A0A2A6CA37_PRIPA|nr:hypothetical protein PRIPAC_76525 [Pristionchus pacificus]|eukprot:PDM75085.1 G protein-coupled receptor [Pristionchus pacificus]
MTWQYFVITLVPTDGYDKILFNISREAFDIDPNERYSIRRHLRSFAVKFSSKTLEMERKFYRVMLLQSILPVVIISIPIGIFIIPSIISANIGPSTLSMTFSVWLVPGTVFVVFVRGAKTNSSVQLKTRLHFPSPMINSDTSSTR